MSHEEPCKALGVGGQDERGNSRTSLPWFLLLISLEILLASNLTCDLSQLAIEFAENIDLISGWV
jgi:hypothetical protein